MKTLTKPFAELHATGRWDIDFHLPAESISQFPKALLKRVDKVAEIPKDKRDPTRQPDELFQYVDIAAVNAAVGMVENPQDLEGQEAPSRARKVLRAFDVLISKCRPTRGAIAVVPVHLHNQIASTAFSVVRPNEGINPFYLHYALRLPSTLEQFRKWSTGSSYPAILDSDVKKTLIPVPSVDVQDAIALKVVAAMREREKAIRAANAVWGSVLDDITRSLTGHEVVKTHTGKNVTDEEEMVCTVADIQRVLADLPVLRSDASSVENQEALFDA